ncbi:MAG: Gfo/Idh/MocA family oxidoreductase [Planctomycetes bacterium]|nr:Gfo/Idh/MocA family oxidoreductase [Planctomycetota bacterium]
MAGLRFALIGCGAVAKKHAEAILRIEDAELAAVCDLDLGRARTLAEKYGVPCYDDHDAMLASEKVDVVTVLTPTGDHAPRVLALVKHGKHIVLEKPLTLRLDDADAMIEACDRAGIRLFVVKQNRYNRPIRALRAALEAGRLGKLVLGAVRVRWCRTQAYYDSAPWRGTWAHDGGVLTNQASHHIDMLEWMMGAVESVTAMVSTRLVKIETEDTGVAILRFRNGALGLIEATNATRPKDLEGSISLLGEKGSVVVGGFSMDKLVTWQFAEPVPEDEAIFATHGENPKELGWNHTEYLRDVVDSIRSGKKALVDGLEGRKSLELINAIYESAEMGREIFLRFRPKLCRLGIPSVSPS